MEQRIRVAIAGIGNCASALVQGIHFYSERRPDQTGLMHWEIGGYRPCDIEVVTAFDIDRRKVGADLAEAIFAEPNCTKVFQPVVPAQSVRVRMGPILDGCAPHMADHPPEISFRPARAAQPSQSEVVRVLRDCGAEILVNYLPVGSERATRFYAECALEAGLGFVNNIPVFIASDPVIEARFAARDLPVLGDDIKSQLGATIVHRVLTELFQRRGVELTRTYQLNTGGNTDFLNMLDRTRLASKKRSKTEAVQSAAARRLDERSIHVGPSDFVAWQKDNKVCFIRMEGKLFGGVPMDLELRLSVEDSPNSAGVAIDAVRLCKLALDRGIGGALEGPSAFLYKHPPVQFDEAQAYALTEAFIAGAATAADPPWADAEEAT